ncbi:MAG: hypothetical protein ABI343_22350 [Burkholderiaceae bacterium]
MDRLLVMRLHVQGCAAEILVNDIPVGQVAPGAAGLSLPVHEYLLDGANEVSLVIDPVAPGARSASQPKLAEGVVGARMRMLLPRIGQAGSELQARTVAEVVWGVPDGEVFMTPQSVTRSIFLPIKFPRWRWLDAPPIDDVEAQRPLIAEFLQAIVVDLMRGEVESYLTASRLRLEELATAYQQPLADMTARLRARLQLLHATKALKIALPSAEEMVLRKCAGGRLIECLTGGNRPVLATLADANGVATSWPMRVAVVNERCHILR